MDDIFALIAEECELNDRWEEERQESGEQIWKKIQKI